MANSEGSDDMLNRVMPKDNIGLAALLKTKEAAWDNGKFIFCVWAIQKSLDSICTVCIIAWVDPKIIHV